MQMCIRDSVGAGHMPLCIQTAAIDEMGVIHAQTLGALIHHFQMCIRDRSQTTSAPLWLMLYLEINFFMRLP